MYCHPVYQIMLVVVMLHNAHILYMHISYICTHVVKSYVLLTTRLSSPDFQ